MPTIADGWVPFTPVATLAAPSPKVIPWMTRVRTPLIALTVALVALDAIGLGLRWADVNSGAVGEVTPRVLQPRVTSPDAVVAGGDLSGSDVSNSASGTTTANTRAGGGSGGSLIGPVAPPVVPRPNPGSPTPGTPSPGAPAPAPSPAVPLAQIDAAVPGAAQISLGAGDNSCTTVDLTLLAPGDCPAPSGEGPVVVHVGGSLLGE